MRPLSLARQVDFALQQMEDELKGLTAGTILLQIRNDEVGKFGIRHLPVDCIDRQLSGTASSGMSADQVRELRDLAVSALRHKQNWTHGEILYDFALRQGKVSVSVTFESNYNMANHLFRLSSKHRDRLGLSNEQA